MGDTLSLNSVIEELKSMQSELRKIGEHRKANIIDFAISYLEQADKQVDEIEQLRVQLAGCSVAALGSIENIAKPGDYGYSQSYQDVLDLRRKYDSKEITMELKDIKNLNDINGNSLEGKLLIATLGRLSTQPGYSNREVGSILKEMAKVAESFN